MDGAENLMLKVVWKTTWKKQNEFEEAYLPLLISWRLEESPGTKKNTIDVGHKFTKNWQDTN